MKHILIYHIEYLEYDKKGINTAESKNGKMSRTLVLEDSRV